MDQAHSIRPRMVVGSLDPSRDPFQPRSSDESALEPQYPYMDVVGALCRLIVHVQTFRSLSICCFVDTRLELSRFFDVYDALKIWVFSLPATMCTVN